MASLRKVECPKIPFKIVNSILEDMIMKISHLSILPFNSNLPHDFVTCYRSLLAHRSMNKYVRPGNRESCRQAAFAAYQTYESDVIQNIPPCVTYGHKYGDSIIRNFTKVCHDFDMKSILRNAPVRFSPGETFIGMEGDTSISAKLSLREHWTVTGSCLDDAVYLIYHCRGLKQAAKGFFPSLSRSERDHLYSRFKNRGSDVGYYVFRYLCLKYALIVVDGARASSVPKSSMTDRFINIEAFFNILVQACLEWYFRRKLRFYGNDLDYRDKTYSLKTHIRDTQHLHGLLIKHDEVCTIDLSNASDSTLVDRLRLLPPEVSACILRTRSAEVIFPDGTIVYPLKVSSMGNGYTFGLMSFLIYFSLLSNNISSNVFGDDIIVHQKDAAKTIEILEYLGYNLNQTKTFIEHPFRESCGYFYYVGYGYIRSFDITRVESITDAIVTCNKCFLLWQDCVSNNQWDLAEIYRAAYKEILGLFQASQKGPVPCGLYLQATNLGLYAYDWGYVKKQKQSTEFSEHRKKCLGVLNLLGLKYEDPQFVGVPYYTSRITKSVPPKGVRSLMTMSGLRGNGVRGKGLWRIELCLVTHTGLIYRFGQLSRLQDEDANSLTSYEPKLPV